MLRDKSLVPLSRQHQHALALCVRIDRASPISDSDLAPWQAEITQLCQAEIEIHFVAEEQVLFPAARRFEDLTALVETLLADHAVLRESFSTAESRNMSAADLSAFAGRMSAHIRCEERQLFERLQRLLTPEGLALLGKQLEHALADAAQSCLLPAEATNLRVTKQ